MHKKILGTVLTTAMVLNLALVGCGKAQKTDNNNSTSEITTGGESQEESKDVEEPTKEPVQDNVENCAWAEQTTFYQIFVRSFADSNGDGIGDFRGIADNVDYLKKLGVGGIWLMPMMDSTTYHGYDVVDYYAVNPDFGTMEDFDYMVKTCHDNGINVIIDFVVNHTSYKNEWFIEALNNPDSKYRDFYTISEERPDKSDPTFSEWRKNSDTGLYYYAHYDTIMPDLNYNNEEVRDAIIDVAKFWLSHDIDGFRLDGAKEIDVDMNVTLDWWKQFTTAVTEVKSDTFIVGENWTGNKEEVSKYYASMPSSFDFIMADRIVEMAKGRNMDIVSELNEMREMFKKQTDSEGSATDIMIDSVMIGNHDMDRVISKLGGDMDKAKLAAAIQFTLPGTPFIYYGEEIGQAGQKPDDNRREPFDWYASAEGDKMTTMKKFFTTKILYVAADDGISVEEEDKEENSILNHYRKLLSIRNNNKAFYNGEYETIGTYEKSYAYKITDGNNKYLIVHNLGTESCEFELNVEGNDLYNNCKLEKGKYALEAEKTLIMSYAADEEPLNVDQFADVTEQEYTVTFRLTVPENTPDEPIYIIGSFDGWKVADEPYIMTKVDATTYEFVMKGIAMSSIEYKYNRGNWNAREQNENHKDLVGPLQKENREYTFEKNGAVVEDVIGSWSDIKE